MMDQQSTPTTLLVGRQDWITHLLAEPASAYWDPAVTMLSRLMAADAHVLAPSVAANLPDAETVLGGLMTRRLDLERALLVLYNRVHGDGRVAGLSLLGVQQRALAAATQYLAVRDRVARQVLGAIDGGTAATLVARWSVAVSDGSSRPHPWLTRHRTLGSIAFHGARVWDRLRDTLDSRPTGTPVAV